MCSLKGPEKTQKTRGNIILGREKVLRRETTLMGTRTTEVLLLMKTLPVINSLLQPL